MDSVLKRKTNRPSVTQTQMPLRCHEATKQGTEAASKTTRAHTLTACAVVMNAASVSNTDDFLCAESSSLSGGECKDDD